MRKILFTVVFIFLLSINVSAEENVGMPGDSVYASQEKQDMIASMFTEEMFGILKEQEVVLLKDSLTPVYFIDPVECLEKGEIIIHPGAYPFPDTKEDYLKNNDNTAVASFGWEPVLKTADGDTHIYIAKSIKYNREKDCSWVVCVDENGNVKALSEMRKTVDSPQSYADYKVTIDRLAEEMGMEISHKDLIYVRICGIDTGINRYFDYGSAYYYNKDGVEMLICCQAYELLFSDDVFLVGDEIIEKFRLLKEKREDELTFAKKYGEEKYNFDTEYSVGERMITIADKYAPQHITHIKEYVEEGRFVGIMPDQSRVIGEIVVHNDVEAPSQTETEKPDIELDQSEKRDTKNENSIDIFDVCGILSVIILVVLIVLTLIKRRE